MTESTSSWDRLNDTWRELDEQLRDVRERFDEGRRRVEDQWRKSREDLEGRVRAQLFETFGLASKSDVERLEEKLTALQKQLDDLARATEAA